MIVGDKNRGLLAVDRGITVVRASSIVSYDSEYTRSVQQTVLELPKALENKIYDYRNGKLISVETGEQMQGPGELVVDYHKVGKVFFFIKRNGARRTLVNITGECLLEFSSAYCFTNTHLCFIRDGFRKFNLSTLAEEGDMVAAPTEAPLVFCCDPGNTKTGETLVFADTHNKIHINTAGTHRVYHWMSNKIVYLAVHDRYVVAASKSGIVARFHLDLQKIEHLFNFRGTYLDATIQGTNLHLLTDFELKVVDLVTGTFSFEDYTVAAANYKVSTAGQWSDDADNTDIFKVKRSSKTEILNLLSETDAPVGQQEREPKEYVTYTQGRHVFMYDPDRSKIVSIFQLESNTTNFICGEECFSLVFRRTAAIINVYRIFTDRLVMSRTVEVAWKNKDLDVLDVYSTGKSIYLATSKGIFVINKMGLLEKRCESTEVRQFNKRLYGVDEKGIFNIETRKYDIEQKKATSCCMLGDRLVFYIEDKGVYRDSTDPKLVERRLILEVHGVMDMRGSEDTLRVLYQADGRYFIAEYKLGEGGMLEKSSEVAFEGHHHPSRLLTGAMCASKPNLLLSTKI